METLEPVGQNVENYIDRKICEVMNTIKTLESNVIASNCNCTDKAMEAPETIIRRKEASAKGNMGEEANAGFARDDSSTSTRLLDKQWSPLLIRKYYVENWPLYVGIISDCNLNDLDEFVLSVIDEAKENGFLDGKIQSIRNFCGFLSDSIDKHYSSVKKGSVEGIGIAWYVDKCFCSSLSKDMMVHKSCRDEFYSILKILPHI